MTDDASRASARRAHESNREAWSALAEWSASPAMNDMEAVMWRAERHPWLSSTVVALEVLDTVPDWDRLRAAHEWGSRLVPRFRQRVVEPAVPVGPPMWSIDPGFDLDYHLRRVVLPPPGTFTELLQLTQTFAVTPLDRDRPLWEATLVEGLDDGRAAYVLKAHHSLSDGIAGMQLIGGVHSRTREPSRAKPMPSLPEDGDAGPLALAGEQLAGYAGAVPGLVRRAVPRLAGTMLRPAQTTRESVRFVGSLRRVMSSPAPPSSLLRPRDGRAWRFQTVECRLADLKAAGRAAGGSVNDAYVAALLGGLRRYHEALGAQVSGVPMAMTVSVRASGAPMGGNRFTAVTIDGPADVADPAERVAEIRGKVVAARAEPALGLAGIAAPLLSRIPSAVAIAMRGRVGAQSDLAASNFPGIADDVYMAGALVERLYAFGPLPGAAVMAALVSHRGVCCIGLNCDGSAIADPRLLRKCVQDGLDEVLALAEGQPYG